MVELEVMVLWVVLLGLVGVVVEGGRGRGQGGGGEQRRLHTPSRSCIVTPT